MNLDFNEARDDGVAVGSVANHLTACCRQITKPAPHHLIF